MSSHPAVTNPLYDAIRLIIHDAKKGAYTAVNYAMVRAYWNIGQLIVEDEQKGEKRAKYGENLLDELGWRLTDEFGRGFSSTNLKNFRKFFLAFPYGCQDGDIPVARKGYTVCAELSWSHYRLLMRVENPAARGYYIGESLSQNWSVRALERQIDSLYFERLLASRDRDAVVTEAKEVTQPLARRPEEFIRDPYVLEFLQIPTSSSYLERDLEQALINKLQQFLLELGKGFSFVSRQFRISTETSEFYVDLVFYHFILKCFVLIDLKTGRLSHQDIGQMDMYVRLFEDRVKTEGDNPTIGIILCTEKDETVVRYSVLNDNSQLFASRYKLYLPSEQELIEEIEREKEIMRRQDKNRSRRSALSRSKSK